MPLQCLGREGYSGLALRLIKFHVGVTRESQEGYHPVALIKNKAWDEDFKALIGLSPELEVFAVTVSINLVTSHVVNSVKRGV